MLHAWRKIPVQNAYSVHTLQGRTGIQHHFLQRMYRIANVTKMNKYWSYQIGHHLLLEDSICILSEPMNICQKSGGEEK